VRYQPGASRDHLHREPRAWIPDAAGRPEHLPGVVPVQASGARSLRRGAADDGDSRHRCAAHHLHSLADDRPAGDAWTMTRRALTAVVLVFQLIVGVVLAEGVLLAMYSRPSRRYPAALLEFFRWEYFYRRNIVQLDTGRARYDAELLYTLRPGRFTFANVEYATPYEVNSLGVRDDEASLAQPEIVVAGDSYAMGWGVQQGDAFPQVIEQKTGRRVLNAAVASYGTVRELRL